MFLVCWTNGEEAFCTEETEKRNAEFFADFVAKDYPGKVASIYKIDGTEKTRIYRCVYMGGRINILPPNGIISPELL